MNDTLYTLRPNILKFCGAYGTIIEKGHSYALFPSGHTLDSFLYVVDGSAVCDFGEYTIDAKCGDLLYLPPDSVHRITNAEGFHILLARFLLDKPHGTVLKPDKVIPSGGANVEHTLRKILASWQMQPPTMNTDCMSMLYSVYSAFLNAGRSPYLPAQKRYYMEEAIRYIDENIADVNLRSRSIAEKLKMSESYFRHSFKEVHNVSPARYIRLQRIRVAKRLLNTADVVSISGVAHKVGFSSVYYFSSAFKKEVKCSPTEWRQKRQIHLDSAEK